VLPASWDARLAGYEWYRDGAGESGGVIHRLTRAGAPSLYLKHGTDAVAAAIVDEAVRLRWLQGRVPAARPVAFADEDGAAWLLTIGVAGRTGDAWLDHDSALLPVIVAAFAGFLTQLHALPVDDCPFEAGAALRLAAARRRVGAGEVDVEDFADDHLGWDAERMLAHTEALYDPDLHQRVVTHGDFSLGNLLMDERGHVTGCIDVGLLGVADPYQDIAILCANLGELDPAAERAFLDAIGVASPDRQRMAFHRCLDELF
ncbi:MAG: APH(3') family aminoglycoside O-phosphotransferase, partial [Pseudomonadota bacterium]|nr:APH(3') family aminoglycoside O-phosphotransferase [Pseudomonadota bacterium]